MNSMFKSSATDLPNYPQALLYCVPPLVAFAIAGYPISGWLIDDAGISFAYARNLAAGAGFVSQPGKVPVEGFSNPLWTLMFVPNFWLSAAAPVWLAKFLGHLFSFGVFFFGFNIVARITRSPLFGLLAMTFLALNTSFVVWNLSGLENALYAFEIVTLAYLGLLTLERISWRTALLAGLLAAAAALTRPEGLIFMAIWPFALLVRTARDGGGLPAAALRPCLAYGAAAAVPFIAYKGIALAYFGDLLPNTYYAKVTTGTDTVLGLLRLDYETLQKGYDLLAGPFGFTGLSLGLFVVTLAICIFAKRSNAPLVFLAGATLLGLLAFVLLPADWMGEHRFGTPFLVLFYPTLFSLIWVAGDSLPGSWLTTRQFPALFVVAVLAVSSIFIHHFRFERFYNKPPAPFATIAASYGDRFNRAAEILGAENGSFLLPDIGGTLFYSNLEIFDLAGLADAKIARSLANDKTALRDYIFNDMKPTFILIYRHWALDADLDSSPRFREQYTPLREVVDEYASNTAGRTIFSGEYVRKDVVEGRADALAQARAVLYGSP
jgi:hypothetical protein